MNIDFDINEIYDYDDNLINELKIEDYLPKSFKENLKVISDINKIFINKKAKKSFNFEEDMFINNVNSLNPKKNIYLKSILININNYLKLKNKDFYVKKFINQTFNYERPFISNWLVKKNFRINKILEKLDLSFLKKYELYHFYVNAIDKRLSSFRVIASLNHKKNQLEIFIFDFYHLFTIENLEKYKENYEKNKNHKNNIKDFFKKINKNE